MELDDIRKLNVEDVLSALGVERKNSSGWGAPAAAGFAVGAVVGGLIGLIFSPESGEERRKRMGERVDAALRAEGPAVPTQATAASGTPGRSALGIRASAVVTPGRANPSGSAEPSPHNKTGA